MGEPLAAHNLAAFVAAVESSNLHDAADALALTQSAVTRRVQALEHSLALVLLERGRFGVRPTAAGRALYPSAKLALQALAETEQIAVAHRDGHPPVLRITASHTIGEVLLPGWLSEFSSGSRRVPARVEIMNSPGVVQAVRERGVEVGFVEHDELVERLDTLVLGRDELVVVVASGHRWARRASVTVDELRDEPFLTRETGSGTRSVALRRLAAHGLSLRPALCAGSTQNLKRAVLSEGFTLISKLTVEDEERLGTLRTLSVEGVDFRRELCAIRHPDAANGTGTRFWAWLQTSVAGSQLGA